MPSNIIELRPSLAVQALHAYYDEATGLPNQMLFMDRLSHALLGASRRGSGVAVFFIDVRPIATGMDDDSPDEAASAALWRGVAERLENRLRPNDTLARLARGQFLLLLEDMLRPVDATRVAERLVQALERPLVAGSRIVPVNVAVGISTRTPADLGTLADDLVLEAERALRQARHNGVNWALITGTLIDADAEVTPESPCVQ
ncbi:MAG TPA: GGDEF domain-containing protein [Dehalococcoidia bacterium]|nr:GGDEF domain-containing protein [Dehalococcoidia bacterium]